MQELIALAKPQPGDDPLRVSGNGSAQHLVGGLFTALTGAPLKHVPYKGSGPALHDLVAGVVESQLRRRAQRAGQVPQGRLKALAVTRQARAQLPDVPTMQEAGVPGYEASVWLSCSRPPARRRTIVQKLNGEIDQADASADTNKALFDAGVEPTPSTPEEMGRTWPRNWTRWGKVVKDAGIKLE